MVPEGYRYRLVGSAVVERHKEETTGKLAGSSHFLEKVRPQLLQSFDSARDRQQPLLLKTGMSDARDHATTAAPVEAAHWRCGRGGHAQIVTRSALERPGRR